MKATRIIVILAFPILGLGVCAVLCGCGRVERTQAKETSEGPAAHEEKKAEHEKPDVTAEHNLKLDDHTRDRLGLEIEEVHASIFQPETVAYGALEEDPSGIFVLRAPVAGMVRLADESPRLELGEAVDAGVLGRIEPRLGTIEYLDLGSRLTQARAEVIEVSAALDAAQSSFEQKKRLNEGGGQLVSQRTLEDAELRVKQETARLAAANANVKQLEAAQTSGGVSTATVSLRLARGGEIVESNLRDGEAVEAGQVLLKVVKFDHVLARVTVPVGEVIDESSKEARIVAAGMEDHPVTGRRIAMTGSMTGRTEGRVLVYLVDASDLSLRPGMGVTAYLPTTKEALSGFIVPRSAIVRYLGHSWVYEQMEQGQFIRRPIEPRFAAAAGWFVESGLTDGEQIVVSRAALLLSEEAKAAIEQEAASVE